MACIVSVLSVNSHLPDGAGKHLHMLLLVYDMDLGNVDLLPQFTRVMPGWVLISGLVGFSSGSKGIICFDTAGRSPDMVLFPIDTDGKC